MAEPTTGKVTLMCERLWDGLDEVTSGLPL